MVMPPQLTAEGTTAFAYRSRHDFVDDAQGIGVHVEELGDLRFQRLHATAARVRAAQTLEASKQTADTFTSA
jgi:hypothetical protein